jgi:hypothetical protein
LGCLTRIDGYFATALSARRSRDYTAPPECVAGVTQFPADNVKTPILVCGRIFRDARGAAGLNGTFRAARADSARTLSLTQAACVHACVVAYFGKFFCKPFSVLQNRIATHA